MSSGQHIRSGCNPLDTQDYIEKSNFKADDSTVSETLSRKITLHIS